MTSARERRVRVALLTQPARLPTATHDPGAWWPELASRGDELIRVDLNAAWWKTLCSPRGLEILIGERAPHGWIPSPAERASLDAGAALHSLQQPDTYASADWYVGAVARLEHYLHLVNERSPEVAVGWVAGPMARSADYADSSSLLAHATARSPYTESIDAALPAELPMIDLLVAAVTSPEDLLSAMTVVHLLKSRQPQLHACLADHGFENFSLRPHVDSLRRTGALTALFDSVVVARDERDAAVAALTDALARGERPSGWLTLTDLPAAGPVAVPSPSAAWSVPPPAETFAPESVLLTRVSNRRCYWSRCTFCIHNAKYDDPAPPSLVEVDAAVRRLEAFADAGYRSFIFMDEALSPALLARLSARLAESDLPSRGVRWACRSKIEAAHTRELFAAVRAAGCCEVLFGIESTSPRTLRRMDKHSDGMTAARMHEILAMASDAGLGLHINIIAGFPGEGPDELADSLTLVRDVAARPNVTFTVNPFVVFPATSVHDDPARFGVELAPSHGDMQAIRPYEVIGPDRDAWSASMEALPGLMASLRATLGWDRYDAVDGGPLALQLYFGSAHGTYLKSMPESPFATGHAATERAGVR